MTISMKTLLLSTALMLGMSGFALAETTAVASDTISSEPPNVPVPEQPNAGFAEVSTPLPTEQIQAPGAYVGWPVMSSDNIMLGKVTQSMRDTEGRIVYVAFEVPNGHRMRIFNGIAAVDEQSITLTETAAMITSNMDEQYTNLMIRVK